MMHPSIDGVALFGSMQRGDHDHFSDRDLLIVSERGSEVEDAFSKAGFSPNVYNWEQIENLAFEGSLFVQHLKNESRVVFDRTGRLRSLLKSFRPKKDYSQRLDENRHLIAMTNGVPHNTPAGGWAFDVLAVAFRNHAILHLAQREIYLFSFSALVRELTAEHGLSKPEADLLTNLRTRKHQYRLGETIGLPPAELQRTQAVIEKITRVECTASRLSSPQFVSRLTGMPRDGVHWYHLLRRCEGAYRAMGFTRLNDVETLNKRIEQAFAKPSPYSSGSSEPLEWIAKQIDELSANWDSAESPF
jgi:predicted nucleotidyltransferase